MERTKTLSLIGMLALLCACGKPATPASADSKSPGAIEPVIVSVNAELKEGKVDDAAAKLMGLRASGHQFNDREAAAFREAMNQAYSAAVEAAAKGDPRGKAAMEMIRASGAR